MLEFINDFLGNIFLSIHFMMMPNTSPIPILGKSSVDYGLDKFHGALFRLKPPNVEYVNPWNVIRKC